MSTRTVSNIPDISCFVNLSKNQVMNLQPWHAKTLFDIIYTLRTENPTEREFSSMEAIANNSLAFFGTSWMSLEDTKECEKKLANPDKLSPEKLDKLIAQHKQSTEDHQSLKEGACMFLLQLQSKLRAFLSA